MTAYETFLLTLIEKLSILQIYNQTGTINSVLLISPLALWGEVNICY